jgi:FixJ family two-component response regulator
MDHVLIADDDADTRRCCVRGVALPDRQQVVAVVDDEAPVRCALERLLRSAGLAVETFASGAEFFLSLRFRQPDCVLLDLSMPGMSGVAVLARLAAAGLWVPTVVITGSTEEEAESEAMHAGAAAVLRKPLDGQILLDALAAASARVWCHVSP